MDADQPGHGQQRLAGQPTSQPPRLIPGGQRVPPAGGVLGDVTVEAARRPGVSGEPGQAASVVGASEMDAVVTQEDPEPVRPVGRANQVVRRRGGDLGPPAQAAELAGQLAAEFCGQPRAQPDGQQVDIRLRVPCPAGGHRSVQEGRGIAARFRYRLDGRAQDRLERLRHPGASHPRSDRPVGRDSLVRITHEDGLAQIPGTARQQVNSSTAITGHPIMPPAVRVATVTLVTRCSLRCATLDTLYPPLCTAAGILASIR